MQHQRVQHALVRPGLTGNQPPAAGARDVGGSGGPSPSCMEVRHADRSPAVPAGRSRAGPRQHPLRRPRQPTAARPDRPRRDRPARARLAGHAMVTARDERSRHDGKPGSRRPGASAPRRRGRTPGPVREASTRHTRAVQMALAGAAQPVRFDRLAAQLATQLPHVDRCKIETMLHGLIDGHVLITNLRPAMTTVDGLAHVIETLRAADSGHLPDVATLTRRLGEIHEQLARHNAMSDRRHQAAIRSAVAESMAGVVRAAEPPLAVDVRLDAEISIPQRVLDEAAVAAGVLLRLTTQPFGSAAWLDYHTRFRTRYGPGALVPVRDLIADSGLGYPPGYLGAPRARPAWRVLTERDAYLLALIQQAMLDGAAEIRLTDADIEALTVGDPGAVVAPARIELSVAIDAGCAEALDRGDFELRVTGAPRAYTSMAGRFAHLLDAADRERLAHTYAPRTGDRDVVAVQLSFPPRRVQSRAAHGPPVWGTCDS